MMKRTSIFVGAIFYAMLAVAGCGKDDRPETPPEEPGTEVVDPEVPVTPDEPEKPAELICPNCGEPILARKGRGRRRVFCSEKCRSRYNHAHPNPDTWVGVKQVVCRYCGKLFISYRETNQPRTYCSVSCARRSTRRRRSASRRRSTSPRASTTSRRMRTPSGAR